MTSGDFTDAVPVPNETTDLSVHEARKTPVAADQKPELQPLLSEDGDEWEGFYEDGHGWQDL